MSLRRWWASLRCLIRRWHDWSAPRMTADGWVEETCLDCGRYSLSRMDPPLHTDRAYEFRRLVSSWSRLSDRLARPAIERASRRGTADMEAPVPEDGMRAADAPLLARAFADYLDRHGEDDPSSSVRAHLRSEFGWSTGARAQTAASSTSTPTPSPGSPRSAEGSSR